MQNAKYLLRCLFADIRFILSINYRKRFLIYMELSYQFMTAITAYLQLLSRREERKKRRIKLMTSTIAKILINNPKIPPSAPI